ncbi:MAG: glutamate--tRNA ligase family protein [Verrucomicrobiae bacterium]|nr:glutamate--tRNA ligase family protein [Verrucomicrobiae bacterium]
MTTRVRFAPSPTGLLHIGGARTALFNWLYARHTGGKFILRIEDTDAARNTQEAVDIIMRGFKWLGIDWDEGPEVGGPYAPYYQSQRGELYKKAVQTLMDKGLAYEHEGAIKFKLPKKKIVVPDLVIGNVEFDYTVENDLVIVRSDGSPVFHLVNVIDDLEMKITHVIRGEEHLSNTPKHLALFEALGATPPQYAHIPIILNSDGSKMSKRDERPEFARWASMQTYIDDGYAPEALRNYLCLLGWSPKDDREIVPIEEVIKLYDLPQIVRHNARFSEEKLHWINGRYLLEIITLERFVELGLPFLEKAGLVDASTDRTYITRVLAIVKEKVKLFGDLPAWTTAFFREEVTLDPEAVEKTLKKPNALERLAQLAAAYEALAEWTVPKLEETLKALSQTHGVKTGEYIHPARVACSGKSVGPSLYHMLEVLGKDRVLKRLRAVKLS